jgi:8-amino-7-oxononanoate synthase
LGCHGAIVVGSDKLRQYLINFARSFIYTTAAPFHQLAAIKASCVLLRNADIKIATLRNLINLFKDQVSLSAHLIEAIVQYNASC